MHFGLVPFSSKYILTILDWLPPDFYCLLILHIFICTGFPLHVMHFTKLLSATALLGSAISAPFTLQSRDNSEMGTWTINNKCQANTYYSVVPGGGSPPGPIQTLAPGQSSSPEQYQAWAAGISIKLASTPQALAASDVLQMEYTAAPSPPKLWYDMSAINDDGGSGINDFHLTPTQSPSSTSSTCVVLDPTNAYQHGGPGEGDPANMTHQCSISTALVLNLCS